MMKMDLGTGSGSKIFQLNEEDIELIVRLLHQECDHHAGNPWRQARYDHMQDLIIELTK